MAELSDIAMCLWCRHERFQLFELVQPDVVWGRWVSGLVVVLGQGENDDWRYGVPRLAEAWVRLCMIEGESVF